MSFVETGNKAMARILVMLNQEGGFPGNMKIHYNDLVYDQLLDYDHLPYRCHVCHEHGHLAKDCHSGYCLRRRQGKNDKGKPLKVDEIVPRAKGNHIKIGKEQE